MRRYFAGGAAICAALLAYAYYLQYVDGLDPCPLCQVQRGFYYLAGFAFLGGALHGRRPGIYGWLAALFALGGAAVAGRHVWLQYLPPEKVPACGPDLAFMLKNLPLSNALTRLFTGTGECAVVDWTFLGLSIAEWSLAWFVALAVYAAWLAISRTNRLVAA